MSRLNVANFRHPDGTSDNISLDDSGQVGVGTASPGAPLSVQANSTAEGIEILGRATDDISEFAFLENDGTTEIGRIQARTTELHFRARQSGQSIVFAAGGITESARIDSSGNLRFNSGYGSVATAYGVRAWIHFQGSGTVSINSHGNISGLTDEGTGEYTISFTNAMPDGNYATAGSAKYPNATNHHVFCAGGSSGQDPQTGSLRFQTIYIDSHVTQDCEQVTVMVVR